MRCHPVLSHFSNVIFNFDVFKSSVYLPRFVSSLKSLNLMRYRNRCSVNERPFTHGFERNFTEGPQTDKGRNLSTANFATNKTKVSWDEYEDIAELLFEKYKSLNPLSLRFTDLHEMVKEVVKNQYSLEVSGECSEGALEKIQMSWLELYEQD